MVTLQALLCYCRRKKSVWTQRFSDFSKCLAWATEFPTPSWFHLWCPFTLARKVLDERAVETQARIGFSPSSPAPGGGRAVGRGTWASRGEDRHCAFGGDQAQLAPEHSLPAWSLIRGFTLREDKWSQQTEATRRLTSTTELP